MDGTDIRIDTVLRFGGFFGNEDGDGEGGLEKGAARWMG